jgi:hypothetical protein
LDPDGGSVLRLVVLGKKPPLSEEAASTPDWVQASPARIQRALARSQSRPSGGWFVLDASRRIGARPRAFRVDGRDLVAWRAGERLRVAPDECPHLGARLSRGRVREGMLVCPWHGLALGEERHGSWCPFESHDDGVLSWVRLDGAEAMTPAPILPARPSAFVSGVIRLEARCEPADVIANRLDPWHGAHYHPYAFVRLRVLEADEDLLRLRVAYRVAGPFSVEVDATFHSPEPRTVVMTIVAGEGEGSVVETHATPIEAGRTAIVEATLASSERRGFRVARALAPLVRPWIERAARRLWADDAAYAERIFELRSRPRR